MKVKTEPAFPKTPFIEFGPPQNGMTLRDYFAARAMQAMIGCADITATPAVFAHQAYVVADAMMKERERM